MTTNEDRLDALGLGIGVKHDAGKLDLTLIPWDRLNLPKADLILPLYRWYREDRADVGTKWVFGHMDYVYREYFGRDLVVDAAAAMNYGARKYEAWNWEKGISRKRLYAAACRHYHAIERGEETDPESGLSHYEHLAFYPMAIFAATDDEPARISDAQGELLLEAVGKALATDG